MKIVKKSNTLPRVRFVELNLGDCFTYVGEMSNNHLFLKIAHITSPRSTFDTTEYNAFDLTDNRPCSFGNIALDLCKVDAEIVIKS